MNKCITQTINKYVKWDDTLYFLGDFCMGQHIKTPDYRAQIECRTIHMLRGNHCLHLDKYTEHFTSIQDVIWTKINQQEFYMSHYPALSWPHSSKGCIMLHGHEHGMFDEINKPYKRLDVGVDSAYKLFGEYRPFSITEVLSICEKRSSITAGHHVGQF